MNKKIKYIISIVISCIILLYLYTFLHEGGHALIAIIYGGKVDKLILGLNAHVQTSGAVFTPFGEALFNSMGVLLPVIFLFVALIAYRTVIKHAFYHIFYGLISICITSTLLVWVIIPFMALFASPPAGDDSTKFLNVTGLNPLAVMAAAVLIIAALVILIFKKGLMRKIKEIIFTLDQGEGFKPGKGFVTRLVIGILLGAAVTAAGLSIIIPKPVLETSISLEVNPATENMVFPFKVEKSRLYSMDMELTAKGFLTDIQMYSGDGTLVYQNVCEWFNIGTSINLEKGDYKLVFTFLKDSAGMEEHFRKMGYKFDTDVLESYKEIYKLNNNGKSYPVSFSVDIK